MQRNQFFGFSNEFVLSANRKVLLIFICWDQFRKQRSFLLFFFIIYFGLLNILLLFFFSFTATRLYFEVYSDLNNQIHSFGVVFWKVSWFFKNIQPNIECEYASKFLAKSLLTKQNLFSKQVIRSFETILHCLLAVL